MFLTFASLLKKLFNSENTVEETNFHIDASFVDEKPEVVNFCSRMKSGNAYFSTD